MGASKPRIVLIHGAMHGGWCWELVAPLLTAAGYEVDAPDLPGCGVDATPPQVVTFADYVGRIAQTVRARPGPVLLVGHSMAGGAISRAAEEAADQVAGLVYLTAMLPKDGERLGTMAQFGEDSVMRGVRPGDVAGTSAFDQSLAVDIFYNSTPTALAQAAVARLARLAPIEPLMAPISLSVAGWGAIPKTYIQCLRDKAMPLVVQQWLCERAPEVAVHSLDTDHSPFFSAPAELAGLIEAIARGVRPA